MLWTLVLTGWVVAKSVQDLPKATLHKVDNVPQEETNPELTTESHLSGFFPDEVFTFDVSARGEEEFFEVIDSPPVPIKGAWFFSKNPNKAVEFTVYDPSNKPIFTIKDKEEGDFNFEAGKQGVYSFVFKNTKLLQQQRLTFALQKGRSHETVLQAEHLDPVEADLLVIANNFKDVQVDQQFARLRQESYASTLGSSNQLLFWLSLVECCLVVGLSVWQVTYVQRLLDNKRVF